MLQKQVYLNKYSYIFTLEISNPPELNTKPNISTIKFIRIYFNNNYSRCAIIRNRARSRFVEPHTAPGTQNACAYCCVTHLCAAPRRHSAFSRMRERASCEQDGISSLITFCANTWDQVPHRISVDRAKCI